MIYKLIVAITSRKQVRLAERMLTKAGIGVKLMHNAIAIYVDEKQFKDAEALLEDLPDQGSQELRDITLPPEKVPASGSN